MNFQLQLNAVQRTSIKACGHAGTFEKRQASATCIKCSLGKCEEGKILVQTDGWMTLFCNLKPFFVVQVDFIFPTAWHNFKRVWLNMNLAPLQSPLGEGRRNNAIEFVSWISVKYGHNCLLYVVLHGNYSRGAYFIAVESVGIVRARRICRWRSFPLVR